MPTFADQKASLLQPSSNPAQLATSAISAPMPARRAPARVRRLRVAIGRLFVIAVVLLAVRTFVAETSIVPTGSMEGTILIGDHLFLNKLPYGPEIPLLNIHLPRWKTVHRGEIVVFRYPRNPDEAFL